LLLVVVVVVILILVLVALAVIKQAQLIYFQELHTQLLLVLAVQLKQQIGQKEIQALILY
jgi:hypothetical protein